MLGGSVLGGGGWEIGESGEGGWDVLMGLGVWDDRGMWCLKVWGVGGLG